MNVFVVNPLEDHRWAAFVALHPNASIFHTPEWLSALQQTYGYEPFVVTTSAPCEEITNGIVVCRVRSWVTGSRFTSLPFSDHCQPLVDDVGTARQLLGALLSAAHREHDRYVELRPAPEFALPPELPYECSCSYYLHELDLRPSLGQIYERFHRSCVQRRIQHAERSSLRYEEGRSRDLLLKFYQLLALTRQRHGVPPQPMAWFENLVAYLGDRISIRMAWYENRPIAGIMTLIHRKTMVYKYGASDARFNHLGATPLLFWRAVQDGKAAGAEKFDLGRSDLDNNGLISFKAHWGASASILRYYRHYCNAGAAKSESRSPTWLNACQLVVNRIPNRFLGTMGRLVYRHLG